MKFGDKFSFCFSLLEEIWRKLVNFGENFSFCFSFLKKIS